MNQFLRDVLRGLQSDPKFLQSKYFYDRKGDALFAKIMACREYYLTRCELEIFSRQTRQITDFITAQHPRLDIVELGPGNAVKSIYLLRALRERKAIENYFPVDISGNIIQFLEKRLAGELAGVQVRGLNGEYLSMLAKARTLSRNIKLVLFLGSNIGNIPLEGVVRFCRDLRRQLSPGDLLLIGVDLKKNPRQIRAAYDDSAGYTRRFNLNLLSRINRELGGDFNTRQFGHYATYDPLSGACRSFLVSLKRQDVLIAGTRIALRENELIYMEISQKYDLDQLSGIARQSGFEPVASFLDRKKWFADVVWRRT